MRHPIGTVEVRRVRGKLVVQGMGRTARGTKFIAKQEELTPKNMKDKGFKSALSAAVLKLFDDEKES